MDVLAHVSDIDDALILHAHPHPDVRRPGEPIGQLAQAVASLGQDLKGMLRRVEHRIERARDELERHILMEQIAHRVDEDHSGTLPLQRCRQKILMQRQVEAIAVAIGPHRA